MREYFRDISFLLDRKKWNFPIFLVLFLFASFLELMGLGLVGAYVAFLTSPDSTVGEKIIDVLKLSPISIEHLPIVGGICLLFILIVRAVVTILVNRAIYRFGALVMVDMRTRAMKHYQSLPYIEHVKRSSAEYIRAILGYSNNVATSTSALLLLVSEGLVSIVMVGTLLIVDWLAVGSLVLLFTSIFFVFDRFSGKLLERAGRLMNSAGRRATKAVHEGFWGLKELRILGCEEPFRETLHRETEKLGKAQVFSRLMNMLPRLFIEISIIIFLLMYIGINYLRGNLLSDSLPVLAMFGLAALRIGPSFALVTSTIGQLRVVRPSIAELAFDLRRKVENSFIERKVKYLGGEFQKLELRGVYFRYPESARNVLNDLDLTIEKGETVGLVGVSGAGKTTLVDLILGLVEPYKGSILFNDQPLKDSIDAWRSSVAYIPQDSFIMEESVWQNIAIGQRYEDVDNARLEAALKKARIYDVVQDLPQGIRTNLGEKGIRLSGGQKQRVVLARALYYERKVLIMDEATSALDDETEKEIIYEVESLRGNVTIIIITHRRTILEHCDTIYRLTNGHLSTE